MKKKTVKQMEMLQYKVRPNDAILKLYVKRVVKKNLYFQVKNMNLLRHPAENQKTPGFGGCCRCF